MVEVTTAPTPEKRANSAEPSCGPIREEGDISFFCWNPARARKMAEIKKKYPAELVNHTLASPKIEIGGALEHVCLAAEGPLHAWTTVLESQTTPMSTTNSMQMTIVLQQQVAVIGERARLKVIRLLQDVFF